MLPPKVLTVEESRQRLTGNRKKIYEHMLDTWIDKNYVPSLRSIARTLFIPFGTVLHHVRKLREADMVYMPEGEQIWVLRGAITSLDIIEECHPISTAYRKKGSVKQTEDVVEG